MNKSSLDRLFKSKLISSRDEILFDEDGYIIRGDIVMIKNKVWIQKDDTLYLSIPDWCTRNTWHNYHRDLSWQNRVFINGVSYKELLARCIQPKRLDYHAKVHFCSFFENFRGEIILLWSIWNDGNLPFPEDTVVKYRSEQISTYIINDVPIGSLPPGEHRYVCSALSRDHLLTGERKYRWKICSSVNIQGGNLYAIL